MHYHYIFNDFKKLELGFPLIHTGSEVYMQAQINLAPKERRFVFVIIPLL